MNMEEKKKRMRPTVAQVRELEERIASLESENALLERSNGYMEDELNRVRETVLSHLKKIGELRNKLEILRCRGFWARLFNRE